MRFKLITVILFILLIGLFISPVIAGEDMTPEPEVEEGTLGNANWTTTTISQTSATSTGAYPITGVYVNTFQNTGNLKAIVLWSKGVGTAFTTDTGAPSGASTPVTLRISTNALGGAGDIHTVTNGRIVGTGTYGYQKVYTTATPPVEVPSSGYLWLALNSWDLGTETGTQYLYMDYDRSAVYNCSYGYQSGTSVSIPAGFATFELGNGVAGYTTAIDAAGHTQLNNKDNTIYASYIAVKPSGIGITGNVSKSLSGVNYTSQAIIYSAAGAIITSESTLTANQFNFSTHLPQVRIGIKDSVGNIYNSSLLFDDGFIVPTPTPTPITGDYTITVLPYYSSYNQTLTGTLKKAGVTATKTTVKAIAWNVETTTPSGAYQSMPLYEAGSAVNRADYYLKDDGKYYGWTDTSNDWDRDKGTSLPNPVSFIPQTTGTLTLNCEVSTIDGDYFIPQTTIDVSGTAALKTLGIYVMSFEQGGYISGSTVSVQNIATGIWTNKTADNAGYASFAYPSGSPLYLVAAASGFTTSSPEYYNLALDSYTTIKLYKTGTGSTDINNSLLLVKTYAQNANGQIQPLGGASITISDGQTGLSDSTGSAQFTILNGTTRLVTASKGGYLAATKYVNPTTSVTSANLYLMLSTTAQPTPFPTMTTAPVPTPTPKGNLTYCQDASALPANATVFQIMKNNIACWGVDDLESQNFAMAALIILICALILGKIGKGDGAAIGGIIGFIFSYAMGFLPFYLLVLAFVLIGAYFSNKFIGGK